jgi:hypothetical protein
VKWGARTTKPPWVTSPNAWNCTKRRPRPCRPGCPIIAPNTPPEATSKFWALNDVGTCLFIRGEIELKRGDKSAAKATFQKLVNELKYRPMLGHQRLVLEAGGRGQKEDTGTGIRTTVRSRLPPYCSPWPRLILQSSASSRRPAERHGSERPAEVDAWRRTTCRRLALLCQRPGISPPAWRGGGRKLPACWRS